MNIKDLPQGSFNKSGSNSGKTLNINNLPANSYAKVGGKPVTTSQNNTGGGFDPTKFRGKQITAPKNATIQPTQQKSFFTKVKDFFTPGSLGGAINTTQMKKDWKQTATGLENIAPAAGGTIGGILGGIAGTAVAGPGLGTYEGAVAGSSLGGAGGELLKEKLQGQKVDPSKIGGQGIGMATAEALGGPLAKVGGKIIEGVGQKLAESSIPTSAIEAKLLQTYKAGKTFFERIGDAVMGKSTAPTTAATTSFKKGLMGTESMIGVRAKRASGNLWNNLIKPQLQKSTVVQDMEAFFKEAEQKIIKENPEISRQKSLLTALESFKEDYANTKNATLEELQKFKEGWAQHIPEKVYKGEDVAGAANNVKNTLAGIARSKIYGALGKDVRQAYLDYGNLKGLMELGQKSMTGGKLKGGFGSFWGAIKDMALTPVTTVGGQTVYKVGQGVELLGEDGARFVRDLFVPSSDTNKKPTTTADIFTNTSSL